MQIGAGRNPVSAPTAKFKVIFDRKGCEKLPPFGDLSNSKRDPLIGRRVLNPVSIEANATGQDWLNAGDRFQQRSLAGPISTNQGDDFTGGNIE
jgi:hypothetical protein